MPKANLSKFFPGKLRIMLDQVDDLGLAHGASWVSEGGAFAIHDPEVFMNEVSPHFFDKQTHLRSFHRQLSIWGFTRLETGAGGRGVWFHKHFIRDKPELIKHIKRVPVKNPKPTLSAPKNQVPDYTNYQLPTSVDSSVKPPNLTTTELPPVHQPHQNNGSLPESQFLPGPSTSSMPPAHPGSLCYLPTFNRIPSAGSQGFPINQAPPPIMSDQAQRFPPFMLPGYQHAMATSMNHLQGLPSVNAPPANNALGAVHQLLACRNSAPAQSSPGEGSHDINEALLAMLMESRNKESPNSNNGTGSMGDGDLISAIARRSLIQQGPKP